MKKNCAFYKTLTASNKDIKANRAAIIAEDVEMYQNQLIETLKLKTRECNRQIMNLEDLSGDSIVSLNPVKDNFKADEWVNQMQALKVELANLEIELEIAQETYTTYFSEEKKEEQLWQQKRFGA